MGFSAWRGSRTGVVLWRAEVTGDEQEVAPDGFMDLMWFRGRLVVAGADTHTLSFDTRSEKVTWGLRFAPGVAHAVLGVSARELTDQRVDLADIATIPKALDHPFDDVGDGLEQVFLALWARADPDPSLLRLAASIDRAAREGLTVRDTTRLLRMPERTLRRRSDQLFGYGPKVLARIRRFGRAMHLAERGLSLSEAATTAGYADQAHFSRDCRTLTGRTPSELVPTAS